MREQDLVEARERIKHDQQKGKEQKDREESIKKISSGLLYTRSDSNTGKKTVRIGENVESIILSGYNKKKEAISEAFENAKKYINMVSKSNKAIKFPVQSGD